MRRRTSRPIKPGTESMRIDAERLAANAQLINAERLPANVHGLPHSPVEGTKAADEVMNSDILGPGSMMIPIRTPEAPPMALPNRVSHGKAENSLLVHKSGGKTPRTVPTRVSKSRKSKDVAIAKLLTTRGPKAKDASKAVTNAAIEATKKDQNAKADSATIKPESATIKADSPTLKADSATIKADPEEEEYCEFEPEDIVSTKIRDGKQFYLVKWFRKPSSENSWQRKEHLYYSQTLIEKFHAARGDKP